MSDDRYQLVSMLSHSSDTWSFCCSFLPSRSHFFPSLTLSRPLYLSLYSSISSLLYPSPFLSLTLLPASHLLSLPPLPLSTSPPCPSLPSSSLSVPPSPNFPYFLPSISVPPSLLSPVSPPSLPGPSLWPLLVHPASPPALRPGLPSNNFISSPPLSHRPTPPLTTACCFLSRQRHIK